MKWFVIVFLLNSAAAFGRTPELLKCLGAEEKAFHLKKDTGPSYDLNQRLIAEIIQIPNNEEGHGGGDIRLRKDIFNPEGKDVYRQAASSRDGAMAILVGVAARNSIDSGKPVKIADLTTLKPGVARM